MAPEVVSGIRYNGKLSDMYSIGATIFCIRFGRPIFSARTRHELHHKILNDPEQFPDEAKAMVSNELLKSGRERNMSFVFETRALWTF